MDKTSWQYSYGHYFVANSVYNGQLFLAILYTYGHYFVANTIYKWSRLIGHKSIKMDRTSWKLLLI